MSRNEDNHRDLTKFLAHMPWDSEDESLMVLKGQLLVEDLFREFCMSKVENATQLKNARLTFEQVRRLVLALLDNPGAGWMWGASKKLNSLRNSLAHELQLNDFSDKKMEFVDFVISEAKPEEELLEQFKKPQQRVAVAIFLLYANLSGHLRFRPQSLFEYILEADDS